MMLKLFPDTETRVLTPELARLVCQELLSIFLLQMKMEVEHQITKLSR